MKSALLLFKACLDETAVIEFLDNPQLDEIGNAYCRVRAAPEYRVINSRPS